MHAAALNGDLDLIRSLHDEQHVSVNTTDSDGRSPIFVAAENGHDGAIRSLHELGANVNYVNRIGHSPIFAAALNGHDSTIRVLHEL